MKMIVIVTWWKAKDANTDLARLRMLTSATGEGHINIYPVFKRGQWMGTETKKILK